MGYLTKLYIRTTYVSTASFEFQLARQDTTTYVKKHTKYQRLFKMQHYMFKKYIYLLKRSQHKRWPR